MLVFLCCCLPSKSVNHADPAISKWAASPAGHTSYQHLKEGLCNAESPQRTVLRLLALLSFQKLHPACPICIQEESARLRDCYLLDFRHHLDGGSLANRNSLRQMAHALWRLVGGQCCNRISLLFQRIEEELPKQPQDIGADMYWWYRITWIRDHRDAWTMTAATRMHKTGGEVTVSRDTSQEDLLPLR